VTEVNESHFTQLFDRAVAACAHAQVLAARCRESQSSARAAHVSARRIRALAVETRAAWAESDRTFSAMRCQVELAAAGMREEGMECSRAAAAVRAHVRFVLYDDGQHEQEAEEIVARASAWVEQVYQAA
jgi:hypothetical protein